MKKILKIISTFIKVRYFSKWTSRDKLLEYQEKQVEKHLKFLKENPQTNLDMFKAIKKRSYRSHLRMIYSKLLEIIKDENIKIGEVI